MDVVSLINMKGGAGKTATCHNLAVALTLSGCRVLLKAQAEVSQAVSRE